MPTRPGAAALEPYWANGVSPEGTSLPTLAEAGGAWDSALGRLVVYGGINGSRVENTTWGYADGNWTNLTHGGPPGGLLGAAMAFDPAASEIVLFGGASSASWTVHSNLTWVYANGTWTSLPLGVHPAPRVGASMTYDPELGGVVLYGGVNLSSVDGQILGDLWLFTGTSWSLLAAQGPPVGRWLSALVYDPTAGELVLFGGYTFGDLVLGDTWAFSAGAWTELFAGGPLSPPPLAGDSAGYDPELGGIVLTGGTAVGDLPSNATFLFNGTGWSALRADGGPHDHVTGFAAWDPVDGGFVVAGGEDSANATDVLKMPLAILAVATGSPNETGLPMHFDAEIEEENGSGMLTWDWGDGNVTVGDFPEATHVFARPGLYHLGVNLTGPTGGSASWSGSVAIAPALELSAGVMSAGVDAGVPVTLIAAGHLGVGPVQYRWSFPGGATSSGPREEHLFPSAGPANVTVIATDSVGANATVVVDIVVAAAPAAAWGLAREADAGMPVAMNGTMLGGTAPWTYLWSFPDGTSATGPSATFAFPAAGTDVVRLSVADSANFSGLENLTVTVAPRPTVSITGVDALVAGATGRWTAEVTGGTGPFLFEWTLPDGSQTSGAEINWTIPAGNHRLAVAVIDAAGARAWANRTVDGSGPSS
ncbi:MAG: PKD domain-containing protein, partial [Thermoplasmata archaeon]